MTPEASYEMPIRPLFGRTWLADSEKTTLNVARLLRALPLLARCAFGEPRLTLRALDPSEYGAQARSLSSLYRLAAMLSRRRDGYDVLHAHFGPVASSFRFAKEHLDAPLVVSFHGYDFSVLPQQD